jgi:RNA polymerase sigma factor (sigma-70 family)
MESDGALALAAKAGDAAAFAALVDRHWGLLRALCRRMLWDPQLAEDAAQEAVVHAMLSLESLRRPERFGAWLGGIGLNVCRRGLQRRGHNSLSWEALRGGVAVREPVDWGAGPEALAEAADLAAAVRRAVADLPRGQRAAILLFYLQGLTYAETAAQLGLRVGTVKAQLHQARRALRRELRTVWEEKGGAMDGAGHAVHVRVADVRAVEVGETLRALTLLAAQVCAEGAGDLEKVAAVVAGMAGSPLEDGREFAGRFGAEIRSLARVPEEERPALAPPVGIRYMILFEEVGGARLLPVSVGRDEGEAIALLLERVETARPLTYQYTAGILNAAGARVREVRITRRVRDTFYAVTEIEGPLGPQTVDSRPSDAVALALFTDAPIRVERALLEGVDATTQARYRAWLADPGATGSAQIAKRARRIPREARSGPGRP